MNIGDLQNAENNTDGIHSALPTELHSKLRAAGLEPATSRLSDEVTVNPHQHCFHQKDREYRNRKRKCSCTVQQSSLRKWFHVIYYRSILLCLKWRTLMPSLVKETYWPQHSQINWRVPAGTDCFGNNASASSAVTCFHPLSPYFILTWVNAGPINNLTCYLIIYLYYTTNSVDGQSTKIKRMPSYAKIAPQRFNERYNIYATLYGANLMGEGEIFTLLWSLMADSNCRLAHYECATLPTESIKHSIEKTGFEPVASALSGRCATTAPLLEKNMGEPF